MAFTYYEHRGLTWSVSDILPLPHMFTARLGGVGESPYAGAWAEDRPDEAVLERIRGQWLNLAEAGDFPAGFCLTRQVHGNLVRTVTEADMELPPLDRLPADCDGLCTARRGVPLAVFTADCVPVLLCDAEAPAAAALHCGWRGTARDMIGAGVRALLEQGARVERIRAAIGPAISGCCFETGGEVPAAMDALLGADAGGVWHPEEGVPGKFLVDLKEANRRRLIQLGVPPEQIDISPDCTMCRADLYWSHRATKGVRGTQASVIMI